MKKWTNMMLGLTLGMAVFATDSYGGSRLGAGVNYWVALDDVDVENVDDNGFSYYISYQHRGDHLLGFQADLELLPDRFGEDAWAPQAYVVIGKSLYAAAGAGWVYSDGDFADEPFFALKAGFDLEIVSGLYLDLNVNYRFNDKADLEGEGTDIDTDTIFFGAAVRFGF
ncbi:MAG TPA: hypothetical protein PKE26_03600 [Kiritimatiellia bacterium]|nr:hypothetical protein [Kiritimatiellia bacterium]HMO98175.1 hypothetical protein [Kiritimatiellia bacterium]HMP97577.1 hypothetical protein [Kiritimatiellia bacterium]